MTTLSHVYEEGDRSAQIEERWFFRMSSEIGQPFALDAPPVNTTVKLDRLGGLMPAERRWRDGPHAGILTVRGPGMSHGKSSTVPEGCH